MPKVIRKVCVSPLIPKKGIEELISEYRPLIAYLSDELSSILSRRPGLLRPGTPTTSG